MNSANDSGINPYGPPESDPADPPQTEKPQTPAWGWGFFVACLAIMIATRGGAIWGAIGGGMGGMCIKVSQANQMPVAVRVLICAVITVALWAAILMLVWSVQAR